MNQKCIYLLLSFLFIIPLFSKAQTYIDLNSNELPYIIDSAGSYALSANVDIMESISTCIRIVADDITLDLTGHIISGRSLADTLIQVENCNNVCIKGGILNSSASSLLTVNNAKNISCENIIAMGSQGLDALFFDNVEDLSITNVHSINNNKTHIHCNECINITCDKTVIENTLTSNGAGIRLTSCSDVVVDRCFVKKTVYGFVSIDSHNVSLRNCTVSFTSGIGFDLLEDVGASNHLLISCNAVQCEHDGFNIGIENTVIKTCVARSCAMNGFFIDSDFVRLENCTAELCAASGIAIASGVQGTYIVNVNSDSMINSGIDTIECDLEHVQDCASHIECCIGTSKDVTLQVESTAPSNLVAQFDQYASAYSALDTTDATLFSWTKTILDRVFALEFKLNQLLNVHAQ